MLTTPEKAEVYRLGLTVGLFEVPDAVTWADQVIMAEANPDNAILEVSMAADAGTAGMISRLKDAAGDQSPGRPRDVVLALLGKRLSGDPGAAEGIAAQLKALAGAYDSPDAVLKEAAGFSSAYAGAAHGDGSVEDVNASLAAFLARDAAASTDWA